MFKCPCCSLPLLDYPKFKKCEKGHLFDKNKKGYTNLLLASKAHSNNPGDNLEMVESRALFLKSEKYSILKDTIISLIKKYASTDNFNFLDIACGEGYYTVSLAKFFPLSQIKAIDLSKFALIYNARLQRENNVKNIELSLASLFDLPFLDGSFEFALNCFAPCSNEEFLRVIKKNGYFIRVLPNANHLKELKEVLYENVLLNEEKDENFEGFKLIEKVNATKVVSLNNQEINNLFKMTPYYYKTSKEASDRLKDMANLLVTIDFKILLYQKN